MPIVATLLIDLLYAFIIVMFIRIIFSWISPRSAARCCGSARLCSVNGRADADRRNAADRPALRLHHRDVHPDHLFVDQPEIGSTMLRLGQALFGERPR